MVIGRPRKIDPNQALDAALCAFREKGFEATSMADLVAATGLHKGSLYQTFGDKHALFLACLEKYMSDMAKEFKAHLNSKERAVEGIQAAFFSMLDIADEGEHGTTGCLAVNSMVEFAERDEDIQALIGRMDEKMFSELAVAIQKAIDEGDVELQKPLDITMNLMKSTMAGLSVVMKSFITLDIAKQMMNEQLDLLGFKLR